jgi:hypothetical protein
LTVEPEQEGSKEEVPEGDISAVEGSAVEIT